MYSWREVRSKNSKAGGAADSLSSVTQKLINQQNLLMPRFYVEVVTNINNGIGIQKGTSDNSMPLKSVK
jgi:hypothetical protein